MIAAAKAQALQNSALAQKTAVTPAPPVTNGAAVTASAASATPRGNSFAGFPIGGGLGMGRGTVPAAALPEGHGFASFPGGGGLGIGGVGPAAASAMATRGQALAGFSASGGLGLGAGGSGAAGSKAAEVRYLPRRGKGLCWRFQLFLS